MTTQLVITNNQAKKFLNQQGIKFDRITICTYKDHAVITAMEGDVCHYQVVKLPLAK